MKQMIRRLFTLTMMACLVLLAQAQPSASYYNDIQNTSDRDLLFALHGIISGHTVVSYDGLLTAYKKTDVRPDGKVWDMYSNVTNFDFGDTGSYHAEGDTYNREHGFPQSWFNKASPMKSDLFHVVPTDGYVNNRRSSYPLADVGTVSWSSKNGFSKLGACSDAGYSGIVFEPNDEYKGDFARAYFYMATRYADKINSWTNNGSAGTILSGSGYQAYKPWYIAVLLRWHRNDPVSQKEIDRNNAVESYQHNRNPFIDYPVLAEFIWGDYMTESVDIDALTLYENSYGAGGGTETTKLTVRYFANGGNGAPNMQTASELGNVTLAESVPTRTGYSFAGWNTMADGTGTAYQPGQKVTIKSSLTLYAQWTYNGGSSSETGTYKYTFLSKAWTTENDEWTSVQDGYGMGNGGVQVTKGASGASATSKTSFTGVTRVLITYCTNKSSGTGDVTVKVGNATKTVAVNGTGTNQRTMEFDFSDTTPSGVLNFTVECTDNSIYICQITVICANPATLHTLSLSAGGAAVEVLADNLPMTISNGTCSVSEGAYVQVTATPAEGKVVSGWTTNISSLVLNKLDEEPNVVSFTMPKSDVSLTATLNDLPIVSVVYHNGSETLKTTDYYVGQPLVAALEYVPTISGYTFDGWSLTEDGELIDDDDLFVEDCAVNGMLHLYALTTAIPVIEGDDWTLVTDASTLKAGDVIIIGCSSKNKAAGPMGTGKFFSSVDAEIADGVLKSNDAVLLTLGGKAGAWTLTTSDGQQIGTEAAKALKMGVDTKWTISIASSGAATISAGDKLGRILYNASSPRFINYTSNTSASMLLPEIYRKGGSVTPIDPDDDPKVYASLADLVADGAPTTEGREVTVTLTDEKITDIYVTSKGYRNGIYLDVDGQEIEIYCYDVPERWEVGGTVSGTLNCTWKLYNSTWELCPSSWDDLTYIPDDTTPDENSFTLTVGSAGFATLYLDFDVAIPEGVNAYYVKEVSDAAILKQIGKGFIPAFTGVIIEAEPGQYTFNEGYTASVFDLNCLDGVTVATKASDLYAQSDEEGFAIYILTVKNGKPYFSRMINNSSLLAANRAYLPVIETEEAASIAIRFEGTTGVDVMDAEKKENVIYDLLGRRVETVGSGLFIVNGKKVIINK